MTTSWAFFCSTNLTTELQPAFNVFGLLAGASSFPATFDSAFAFRRALFCNFVSGRYFSKTLKSWTAVCLSNACENWLIGGGILRRFCKIALWRWMRMYFGHLTKRERSRLGWTFWPKIVNKIIIELWDTHGSLLTNSVVLRALLKQRVGNLLGDGSLCGKVWSLGYFFSNDLLFAYWLKFSKKHWSLLAKWCKHRASIDDLKS